MFTSKKRLMTAVTIAVLIIIVIVVALSGTKSSTIGATKIGLISSLSGLIDNGDNLGQGFANGARLAYEQYVEKSKNSKLTLAIEDDGYDSKKGMSAYQKLISIDKVDSLINLSSPTIDVIKGEAQKQGFPVLQLGAEGEVTADNVFQMYPDQTSVKMLGVVANKDGVRTVTVVMEQVKAYEKFISDFENAFSGTTNIIRIPTVQKDYASIALKIKENNSDAVLIFTSSKVGSQVLLRLSQLGYKPSRLYFDLGLQLGIEDYKTLLGNSNNILEGAEGLYSIAKVDPAFSDVYKKRFGAEPGFLSGYGYDTFNVMIKTYDSNKAKWVKNVQNYTGEGVTGKISFDNLGLRPPEFVIAKVKDGQLIPGATSQPTSAAAKAITVGVILPLTGQYSVIGETVKNGMEMSLKALTADDQKNIKLIFEDDKYTTKDALSAYQKLTSLDHADIIVSISSPTVEITKPEVNKSGQLMFILGDELSHDKDRVFELMPQGAGLFKSLAVEAAKHYKSISIIYASDNNLFKTNSDLFKAAAPANLAVHLVPVQGNSDIRTEVSQVAKSGDEAFAIFVPLETGVKILNEMKKYPATSKPHLLCDANLALTVGQYISAVGVDTFEGCISTVLADTKTPAFVSAYKATYSSDPQFGSDYGYDAVQIIGALIKKGGKDSWVSTLNDSFTYSGYSGKISLDETGTRAAFTDTQIFKGGKFVKIE